MGEITLNYVSPEARFQGVSKTLVAALERRARERGSIRCTLSSTKTARRFYLDAGYTDNGTPQCAFGMLSCFPMAKRIDPS